MKHDTFGNPAIYPSLIGLTNLLSKVKNKNRREFLSKFITKFNSVTKELHELECTEELKSFLVRSTRDYYKKKLNDIKNRFSDESIDLLTHLDNFIFTKIKTL